MSYPGHADYKALYLRYHSGRDIRELLDLLEPIQGASVLDLCCGEGQLSVAAHNARARKVTAVDKEERMFTTVLNAAADVYPFDIDLALRIFTDKGFRFDRVVCRQAINYWLNVQTAGMLAGLIPQGGIFAFNTFNQKPPEKPRVREYELGGNDFVEVSWLVGDTVHHVQVRNGMAPHTTCFQWLPGHRIRELLEPYFILHEQRVGPTSLYKCEKKSKVSAYLAKS